MLVEVKVFSYSIKILPILQLLLCLTTAKLKKTIPFFHQDIVFNFSSINEL